MQTVRLQSNGRLRLPEPLVKEHGFESGQRLVLIGRGDFIDLTSYEQFTATRSEVRSQEDAGRKKEGRRQACRHHLSKR